MSADPAAVLAHLASLDALGDAPLRERRERTIVDRYLDGPQGPLAAERFALRLRRRDGGAWLALKGEGAVSADGMSHRPEWEAELSSDADLEPLLERIAERSGARVDARDLRLAPEEALASAGLETIQLREMRRETARVHLPETPEPIAELALDAVRYRIGGATLVHREVELEARPGSGAAELAAPARALATAGGDALRPWTLSKLATGFALERLAAAEPGRALGDDGGNVAPWVYARLADAAAVTGGRTRAERARGRAPR